MSSGPMPAARSPLLPVRQTTSISTPPIIVRRRRTRRASCGRDHPHRHSRHHQHGDFIDCRRANYVRLERRDERWDRYQRGHGRGRHHFQPNRLRFADHFERNACAATSHSDGQHGFGGSGLGAGGHADFSRPVGRGPASLDFQQHDGQRRYRDSPGFHSLHNAAAITGPRVFPPTVMPIAFSRTSVT